MLNRKGIIFDLKALTVKIGPKNVQFIKRRLTLTYKNNIGNRYVITKAYLYKLVELKTKTLFMMARFNKVLEHPKLKKHLQYIIKRIPPKEIKREHLEPGITLRNHQSISIDYLMDEVYSEEMVLSGRAGCTFVMDTGLGKSYVAAKLIENFAVKTLIIIPKTSIIEQWRSIFEKACPSLTVGEYHSKCKKDGDVVIMTIDSAISDEFVFTTGARKTKVVTKKRHYEYFKEFGFVIFDEIPNYVSKTRREIFWRTNFKYVLGLTATPGERSDGFDAIYEQHVGPLAVAEKLPNFNTGTVKWKGSVTAVKYHGPPEHTKDIRNEGTGWVSAIGMVKQFAEDPYRNKLIVDEVAALVKQGKFVFVFAEIRDMLEQLQQLLHNYNLEAEVPELKKTSKLMGGATEATLEHAQKKSRIILITYGYGSEAISFTKMDALVLASPRMAKTRQTLGRILRLGGDTTKERIIVDIVDWNATSNFKRQYYTRRQAYSEKGFPIKDKKVIYSDITIE
jgi:superfamily II DNA or RNA helicase